MRVPSSANGIPVDTSAMSRIRISAPSGVLLPAQWYVDMLH